MLAILKIVHFLALAAGLGGGIANAVIGATAARKAPEVAGPLQLRIGRVSFVALVLLWITGLWMAFGWHGVGTLGLWFWVKMLAVLALTAAAVAAQLAIRNPGPGTPARMRTLGQIMLAASTLAVIFAVLALG